MEKKKLDLNSILGFVLIGVLLMYMLYTNTDDNQEAEKAKPANQEVVEGQDRNIDTFPQNNNQAQNKPVASTASDSTAQAEAKSALGAFGYSATLPSATDKTTTLENDVLKLEISNKGGQIVSAKLKNFKTYDSVPVYLIKDKNASFNLSFSTSDNRNLTTQDLYFEPTLSKNKGNNALSMKLKVSDSKYLEYYYELKPGEYMLDFNIRSNGLSQVLNANKQINLDWKLKAYRNAQSISYENRYTELNWEYEDGKDDYIRSNGDEQDEDITWVAYRQHFFSSILLTDQAFENGKFTSKDLVEDEDVDTTFTKSFATTLPLKLEGGELNKSMNWYYGPTDYQILKNYDRNLDEIVPLGWGIFGWINEYAVIPFFNFLMGFLPAGIAVIFLTITAKILLSPIQYKQYVSQAKMRILKPEINEINEKYKDSAVKKQQETMKLYRKAGASPMSGCLPGIAQIPVFYALFSFFPSALALRHESFLWANDLSSYDVIAELPFTIWYYGDHVSLFPILASIAIFIYMMLNSSQNMPQSQPGMPNMKYIMYLSPIFMLFFFNNYASGLSLYYLTSNVISIAIILVIKNFIVNDDKIHAKIQASKKKPKKQNRFSRKMQEMMDQAEQQKNSK